MNQIKAAVIAFPGNNCEIETRRALVRNNFEARIFRWNETAAFVDFDPQFIVLPGGFSFEDRIRSGVLATKKPIFDEIRKMAKNGTIIMGICNGAQMVVESGLIPVGTNPLPYALAHNIRHDETGNVIGTGFLQEFVDLEVTRTDTAFTQYLVDSTIPNISIAHAEGRFVSIYPEAKAAIDGGVQKCFGYVGRSPNGAYAQTAAITNAEGTIMAMMPHPERFFEAFSGDVIFASVYQYIVASQGPDSVVIGDVQNLSEIEIQRFFPQNMLCKNLLITDNEAFSLSQAVKSSLKIDMDFSKMTWFDFGETRLGMEDIEKIKKSGYLFNPNKERFFADTSELGGTYLVVKNHADDEALHLSKDVSVILGREVKIEIYKAFDVAGCLDVDAIVQSRILANENAQDIYLSEV